MSIRGSAVAELESGAGRTIMASSPIRGVRQGPGQQGRGARSAFDAKALGCVVKHVPLGGTGTGEGLRQGLQRQFEV
jgi:hypothetical protein